MIRSGPESLPPPSRLPEPATSYACAPLPLPSLHRVESHQDVVFFPAEQSLSPTWPGAHATRGVSSFGHTARSEVSASPDGEGPGDPSPCDVRWRAASDRAATLSP